jgi:hypothetical protein
MPDSRPLPAPALNERREQTIRSLISHFSQDRLTVEQFEHRLDLAHLATTSSDLDVLVADLPSETAPVPAPSAPKLPTTADPESVRKRDLLAGIMGGVERRGHWTPAQHSFVVALLGGAELDLREARLGPGETEITIFAFWGGVEILVPPGMRVDVGGIAIMGGFEHQHEETAQPAAHGPLVKINGVAIMGGVEVATRLPGESARDAKKRRREERKRLREEKRR